LLSICLDNYRYIKFKNFLIASNPTMVGPPASLYSWPHRYLMGVAGPAIVGQDFTFTKNRYYLFSISISFRNMKQNSKILFR